MHKIKPISIFYHHLAAFRAKTYNPKTVLDIGGSGRLKPFLDGVHVVSAKYPKIDGRNLLYPDNKFDITCSIVTLEHVGKKEDQFKFLAEAYRVSKFASIHLFPVGSAARGVEQFKRKIGHKHPCLILDQSDFLEFLDSSNINYGFEIADTLREHLIKLGLTFPKILNDDYLNYLYTLRLEDPYCILLEMIKCPLVLPELKEVSQNNKT